MRTYRYAAIILAMLSGMASIVWCQQDTIPQHSPFLSHIGLNAAFGPTFDLIDVPIPGRTALCGSFTSGDGFGMHGEILFEFPKFLPFPLQLRPGFHYVSGSLAEPGDEFPVATDDGEVRAGRVDHLLEYQQATFGFGIYGQVPLFAAAFGELGIGSLFTIYRNQTYKQVVAFPSDLLLANDRQEAEIATGTLLPLHTVVANLHAGVRYDLPIGKRSTISPLLALSVPLTNQVEGGMWRGVALQVGAMLRFGVGEKEPVVIPKPPDTIPELPKSLPVLIPTVLTEPSVVSVSVTEYDSIEALPLLNRIFFAENSAVIPDRYYLMQKDQTDRFTNAQLTGSALDVYHHALNIIASRMQRTPEATLTISGYRNSKEQDIGMQRAQAIRAYFIDVWGIAAERLTATGGNLPRDPANENTSEGLEENARVEIIPSDLNITAPVPRRHVQRIATPPLVTFYPRVISEAGVKGWKLEIVEASKLWKGFGNSGALPDSIVWGWRSDSGELPLLPMRLGYRLSVTDSTERQVTTDLYPIRVRYDSLQEQLENRQQDTIIQSYSLLLFEFNSPKVSQSDRALIRAIAGQTMPGGVVRFTGYTDSLGNEAYNKRLATARAQEASQIFKGSARENVLILVNENGGERDRFPNDTPEGRYYNRTVIIDIRTPAVKGDS